MGWMKRNNEYDALLEDLYSMQYNDFLIERRKLMSKVIKEGYERLMK